MGGVRSSGNSSSPRLPPTGRKSVKGRRFVASAAARKAARKKLFAVKSIFCAQPPRGYSSGGVGASDNSSSPRLPPTGRKPVKGRRFATSAAARKAARKETLRRQRQFLCARPPRGYPSGGVGLRTILPPRACPPTGRKPIKGRRFAAPAAARKAARKETLRRQRQFFAPSRRGAILRAAWGLRTNPLRVCPCRGRKQP